MKHYHCCIFLVVIVFAAPCLAQSDEVSLGDLARRNKASHGKPVMVFNDENTQRTAVAEDSSPASGSTRTTVGQTASAQSASSKKPDGKTSASSSNQADKLKKELDSLKQQQSVWSNSAKSYQDKLANETSDFRRQTYEEALHNDQNNVQVYQHKIDQVQNELNKAQQASSTSAPASSDSAASGSSKPQ